ncbi:MAG TPA: hypothetical protein VME86_12260 [Acidobacteriaceae bacterium]|nr:hypothetical protein [Acidobacteriaceae bacterium]
MTALLRSAIVAAIAACFAAAMCAQQPSSTPVTVAVNTNAVSSSRVDLSAVSVPASAVRVPANAQPVPESWFLRHYGIGTYSSPLGFGGRIAVSLADSLNLRAGAGYFNFGFTRSVSGVPFSTNVVLQSEQASLDWYPFHNSFHLSPGVLFGSSNRAYGTASISAGSSFTLNNVTYYSSAADPVQASGSVRFARTAPTFTLGWGKWVRGERQRHWAFPFEMGFAYVGDPTTALNFTGVSCTDAAQQQCQNIASDPSIQANIAVEQRKLQNDADWLRFYPIVAGGMVYRF